ncbi:MAG: EpsI family protein [Acidobacteria bacterium]|nr:EpsI family protein [Acidobacteriota bacterium]
MRPGLRFSLIAILLGATAIFLQARGRSEVFPPRQPLQAFPHQLQAWSGSDVFIPQEIRNVLGAGDFLLRIYRQDDSPSVDLFVAYFPSQRAGDTIHSPKNCLPGAGWSPVDSSRTTLNFPGQPPLPVNRYIIAKGNERQLVLYWYWAHDRAVASEYWAKFYLIADSIRMNRSDGSLVRVTTRLAPDESAAEAEQRLVSFAGNVVPLLNAYVPR